MTKVLYIEHDDDNLYMLKMRLERAGDFEVLAAEDSEKGCKLAATGHPDVILLNLEMSVVDRWELLRALKNDPQTRDIPIIGVSAFALDSEHSRAGPRGPTGLVVQLFRLILAAKDCATIFPFRTTNVSVANSYELSAVSAVQRIYP